MAKKHIAVTVCIIALTLTVIGFSMRVRSANVKPVALQNEAPAIGRVQYQFPDHVRYEFLFRKIQFLVDKNIPDSRFYEMMQEEYGLNAAQAERLKQVALSSIAEVKLQDIRAHEIINQVKARYPKGVVPKGQKPPSLPPELVAMQSARNEMILRARSDLQVSLGDQSFSRFDERAKKHIKGAGLSGTPIQR